MSKNSEFSLIGTLTANILSNLFVAYTSLEHLRINENLSPSGLLNIKTAELCNKRMNLICRLIDYIVSEDGIPASMNTDCFDCIQLFSAIKDAFNQTVAGYSTVSTGFEKKLDRSYSVQVNKTVFETIVLSLLYCCMKAFEDTNTDKGKITFSVGATKDNIVFHIRTNTISPDSKLIEEFLTSNEHHYTDIYAPSAVLALTLEVASAFIRRAKGRLSFTTLKSGNRYDIYLPKYTSAPKNVLLSPIHYFPALKNYEEFFAEFKLAYLTKNQNRELTP